MLKAFSVTNELGKPYNRLPSGTFSATKRTFVKDITASYSYLETPGTWNPSPWHVRTGAAQGPAVWVPSPTEEPFWRDTADTELVYGAEASLISLNGQPISICENWASYYYGNAFGFFAIKYDSAYRRGVTCLPVGLTLNAGDSLSITLLSREDEHSNRVESLAAGQPRKWRYGFIFDVEELE